VGCEGARRVSGCRNVRTSLPIDVPEANVEPLIAFSSSPPEPPDMGAGVIDHRDVAGCRGLDPGP
jgi:hypothetical protein